MPKLLDCGLWEGVSPAYGAQQFTSATMACLWIIDATNPIFGIKKPARYKASGLE